MIITAILAMSIGSTQPKLMPHAQAAGHSVQIAGLFGIGKSKRFTEIVQQVQVEHDHAPTVGRQAEPAPEPFVPVRYLTPEQRAEPIIIEPAPIYVAAEEQKDPAPEPAVDPAVAAASALEATVQSFITSVPQAPPPVSIPSGSATGSNATADYGTPG